MMQLTLDFVKFIKPSKTPLYFWLQEGLNNFTSRLCKMIFLFLFCQLLSMGNLSAGSELGKRPNQMAIIVGASAMEGWAVDIVKGIQDVVFLDYYTLVSLRNHYLASNEYTDIEYSKNYAELISHEKFIINQDVHILVGADAVAFFLHWQDQYFKNSPAVFCAVNDFVYDLIEGECNITGLVDTLSLFDNINMVKTFHPETRENIFLGMAREDNLKRFEQLEELTAFFGGNDNLRISSLLGPTPDSLSLAVKKANTNPVRVAMSILLSASGSPLPYNDPRTRWNRGNAPYQQVPVYSIWKSPWHGGSVGGKIFVEQEKEKLAAQMALRIILGEKVENMPVVEKDSTRYVFNYKALRRFGINQGLWPEEAEILNKPVSLISIDRNLVWSFGIMMGLLVVAVLLLLFSGAQRRKITKELKESQIRIHTLIQHLPEWIYMKDAKGTLLHKNWSHGPNFDLDVPPDGVAGKTDYDFYPLKGAEEFHQEEQAIINTGKAVLDEEVKSETATGKIHWHNVSKIPFNNPDGKTAGIIGIVRDVTQRKQEEEELLEAKETAESAYRAKSEFLAMISDEIRTPMNSVLGFCQILESTSLSSEQRKFLQKIVGAGDTLINIIDDILNYSQIESGRMEIKESSFVTRKVIGETIDLLTLQSRAKGIALELDITPDVPDIIVSDSHRLKQILLNVAGNAIKFTEQGKVRILVRMDFPISIKSPLSKIRDLVVSVEDTGIGIGEKMREILFQPFSQADTSSKRRHSGTGLGLAICRRLLIQLGGSIDFSSQLGIGSKFTFYLPVKVPSLDVALFKVKESLIETPQVTKDFSKQYPLSILVVEDNPDNLFFISQILGKLGYIIEEAGNGRIALQKFREKNWDLILMDIQMPEMDGLEATRLIRIEEDRVEMDDSTSQKDTYIAALTAFAMQSDRQLSLDAGMNTFLSKPLLVPELVKVLQAAWQYGENQKKEA